MSVPRAGDEFPGEANEARIDVTLGEFGSSGEAPGGFRKMGSLFQEGFGAGAGGAAGGRAGAGGKLVVAAAVLKTWVKLPSPEAEPETPGEENPFARDGLAGGRCVDRVFSSTFLSGVLVVGCPETKTFVNSPGPRSGAC